MRTRAHALIGRESELAAALGSLRDGPACFLLGEPGVGKSRLIGEVSERARADGWVVARGRASSIEPVSPLRPFAEALAAVQRCGLLPENNLGGYRPLLARVLPELSGPAGLGPGEALPLVAFAEAVLRLLSMLARSAAGCLLVLEDLHDADPDSLAVLEYLLDNAGSQVALLGALRAEPGGARDLLVTAERRRAAELLPVRPLSRANTGLLVAACLGADQSPAQLAELAWRNTAGNPLAVEELLYNLIEDGQLRRHREDWRLSASVVAPPPSMLQLIGTRLGQLNDPARSLVITAAVYGEHFPLVTVQAAVGEADYQSALHDATTAQLVVAERPGWHRFHHPLTHTAVLELTGATERRRAATALAEATLAEDPEPTATNCRTAARLLAEAGQSVRASELYARSGKLALGNGAIEVAVADLTEAMRLADPDIPLSSGLISDLIRAWRVAGQLDRAVELVGGLDPADEWQREQLAQLYLDLARSCDTAGREEQARLQLAKARSLATGTDNELLQIHCEVIAARVSHGSIETAGPARRERQARALAEAAERLVSRATETSERQAAAEVACRAWVTLMWILDNQGRYQEAVRLRRRIHALAERDDLPHWAAYAREDATLERSWIDGDDLPVRALLDEAQRSGNVAVALAVQVILWKHEMRTSPGSLVPVVAGLTSCAEQARRLGFRRQYENAVGGLVMAANLRADHHAVARTLAQYGDAASASLTQALDLSRMFGLALEGRDSEALAALQDLDRQGLIGRTVDSLEFGLLLLLGSLAGTAPPKQITEALGAAGVARWIRQFLHWAAAVHAGRRGDRDEAERHAEQAAAEAEIYPVARHLAARLVAPAAAADGWGHPIEDLRAAEAWFHEQGVAVAARTCRDLLRSLGAPVQQRRNGTATIPADLRDAGVTMREYEVGLLVREHLGNQDIGQRLHISPRTVEKHVAALQIKLAVQHRRALINRLTAHGAYPSSSTGS